MVEEVPGSDNDNNDNNNNNNRTWFIQVVIVNMFMTSVNAIRDACSVADNFNG